MLYIWFQNTPSHPWILFPGFGPKKCRKPGFQQFFCAKNPVVSDAPKNSMACLMVSPGTPNNRGLTNS